jgi:hypothetical protein
MINILVLQEFIGIKLTGHKRRTPEPLLAGGSSIRNYPDRDVKQGKYMKKIEINK